MLPQKSRYVLYVLLILALSVIGTSAIAKTSVYTFITEVVSTIEADVTTSPNTQINRTTKNKTKASAMPMFMTIIQGADEEVTCADDGSTVARFSLCGDFDDRTISLAGAPFGSVEWEQVTGGCTPDVNTPCPSGSCTFSSVGGGQTFSIDASTIPAGTGAEFRVRADGTGPWYYFEVTKSTITQTYVKTDFVCGVDGRIQITGLSSAYEFSIDSGSGFGPWQGPMFDNLTPGTYNVKARLQNTPGACEYPYEPIVIEQQDMVIEATFVDVACSGETGSITVNVNNTVPGPYKYTLLDNTGTAQEFTAFLPADNYTFAAVGVGTYSVQVETQQCTGDPLNGIDPPRQNLDTSGNPITIGNGLAALDASTEVNSSFGCSTITDVDITLNVTGGSAPYTFTVNGGPIQPSFTGSTTYNVTTAGTYDFIVTDSNGCTIPASSNVENLSPPDVTASGVDGTCSNGGARINFNVINANGYNLSYRVNAIDPWDTNPSISVPAGTYNNIEVRYQQGGFECTVTLPAITVTNVGVISGSATKVADRTCDGSGGTIGGQIDFGAASGGSGSGYVFSIDGLNFSATTSFTGLVPGTYTPMIEDGGGCRLALTAIDILDVDPPTDIDFIATNSNCAASTVDLQLVPTSNVAITNYSIISPSTINNGGSDTFVSLDATQSYIFQITDANNCTYTEGYSPAILSTIRARVKSGGDTQVCFGAADGSGAFLIDGFANNYTYNINGAPESAPQNAGEVSITGLAPATYTITITDVDTGCTDTANFTVQEPASALALTATVTAMTCANGNLGRVVAQTTGGWGNNRFTLVYPGGGTTVGPKAGPVFGNLSLAGTYTLSVTDAEGCSDSMTFDLTPIDAPTITLDNVASDFCYVPGTGATMVVTSTAGSAAIGTHQFRINGGTLQAGGTFTNLSPGGYSIEVVDGNNCSASVNLTVRPQLRVNTSITGEIPCGAADGEITVQVTGGYLSSTTPKSYEVSTDNGVTFSTATPFTTNTFAFNTSVPGDYIFRVSDNQGCIAESNLITLNPPQSIDPPTVVVTPASCGQTNNGIVTITPDATSGVPAYEINFNNTGWGTQATFSNLIAGNTYPYAVRDSRGCETLPASVTIPLDATPPPDATVVSNLAICSSGTLEGSIDVTNVTGGTANFTYILQDEFGVEITRTGPTASTTTTFANLAPGNYSIVTIDALGCRDIDAVTVIQTNLTVVPDPVTPVCDITGFSNTVEIFGGVGPFLIRLENDPAAPVTPNIPPRRHTFIGLQFGVTYTVEVTDVGTGCVYLEEIPPVEGPSSLDVTAATTPGYCDVNRFGQISYDISGFLPNSDLIVEVLNTDDGTRITIESPTNVSPVHSGTYEALPGNYQIIVTDLTDNCSDATAVTILQNLPAIDILSANPANCTSNGSITVQGNGGGGGPYNFAFMTVGATPTPGDFTPSTTFFGPAGNYDVYVQDATGCTSFAIAEIIPLDPALPAPIFAVDNQCAVASPSFDIIVRVPSTVDTPRFTLGGDTRFPTIVGAFWEATYVVNTPGNYIVNVIDANGCTSQGTADVFEFISASGDFSTESTCNDANGAITIIPNGGSGNFDYELTGTNYLGAGVGPISQSDDPVFTGVTPGTYQVLVTDRDVTDGVSNCTFTVSNITLDAAIPPVILPTTPENISCNGDSDGSIDIVLQAGTDFDGPIDYRLLDFVTRAVIANNASGSFPDLTPGSYEVEVVSTRNCIDLSGELVISEPPIFTITAAATPFTCESGSNRFSSSIVTATITSAGTPTNYRYSITGFENYQTSNTFEIVDNGSTQNITVYAIDDNGCQTTASVPISPPLDVIPSIVQTDLLNCRDPERVRIEVIGTTDFTVTTVSAVPVAPVTNTAGNNYVDVFLPVSGDYLFEVQDNLPSGCAYPMPIHTVIDPIQPTVVIAEANPIQCFGGSDGELSIEVTDYTGLYSYTVYSGSDPNKTTPIATGNLDTANNPELITGLTGGNFFVEVTSTGMPFCSGDSNIATIRTPNGVLDVTAVPVGNVSCNDNTGVIEATGVGGWDTTPYEYRLLQDSGSGYVEVVVYSNSHEFQNLSSGDYRVEIRDVEGCTDTFDINLPIVPQIDAGIREPLALQCPNGNNAILEAFDPTSGDAITATAGASGGFLGAGYTYRLLYLNSNDNTDIASSSGLQNTPTFIGASGGFISGGWYAIEVTSSYECSFVTVPYLVSPPPPIEPRLIQTRVPGCGGLGEMRLFVENPDAAFTYEFVSFENGVQVGVYADLPASASLLIPGTAGVLYQYDVRKKNASNTCLPVRSNGVTMTDASGITLLPNLPDDISCASELDGRIESFINGGVGGEMFTLYNGDPVDAFSPAASATVFRGPQDNGTFEGLPQGADYYIAVTSGATCSDIAGPFEIVRPDPILYTPTSTSVSCNGEADGSVTFEVTSGGIGLIQFAIAPNFNEFFSEPTTPGIYTFEDLAAGSYEVLIQDENGCFERAMIDVIEPEVLNATLVDSTPETCIGFEDGTATISITGGTPFVDASTFATYYETKIIGPNSDGSELFVRNDNLYFENLIGGETYIILVQDANLCPGEVVVPIEIGVDLTAEAEVLYGCEGIFPSSTSTVRMTDDSLISDLLFALDPIDPTDAISANAGTDFTWGDLPAGDHTVYIYHQNGCTNSVMFTTLQYEPLILTATKTGPNEVTAVAEGGFGNYEYFFQGESTGIETVYTTNESTVVNIEVRDEGGCVAMVTIPFEFTGMLDIPNFFTPDGDNNNDVWAPKNREFFPNIDVKIYDRYGRVVEELDQVQSWDGNYNDTGNPLPSGDYWYVINANDKSKIRYVGHFTLYR